MTIEEKLKELILQQFSSLRNFTTLVGLPYSTVDGILKRGIKNATISNVLTICDALGISADELGNGKIVPVFNKNRQITTELDSIISFTRMNVDNGTLTIDGKPLKQSEMHTLLDAIEIGVGIIRRNRERAKSKK